MQSLLNYSNYSPALLTEQFPIVKITYVQYVNMKCGLFMRLVVRVYLNSQEKVCSHISVSTCIDKQSKQY